MSESTQVFYSSFRYRDARAAIDWLVEALGVEGGVGVDGEGDRDVAHAPLTLGPGPVMLGSQPSHPGRYAPRAWLRIDGSRLATATYVQFAVGPRRTRWVRARRRSAGRLLVQVPGNAVSGRLRLWVKRRPVSRASRRVTIVRVRRPAPRPSPGPGAFAGQGMWIWQLPRSEGGSGPAIVARARSANIQTVFVKGADGTNLWSQFTPALVASLKAAGLRVCAWQYTYGSDPAGEAATAAQAIARGADCFVIDAEAEYEGHYAQALQYVRALRARVGGSYPLALSSFPYVDYHPNF